MALLTGLTYHPVEIIEIRNETPRTKTLRLKCDRPITFIAGQHAIFRVTLSDGFQTSREYSISSAPSSNLVEISVAKAPSGIVSGWLHGAKVGDHLEMTDPKGSGLLWSQTESRPILLIGGGSGMSPLMSIIREHRLLDHKSFVTVLCSARNFTDINFYTELVAVRENERIQFTLVETIPGDWQGHSGFISKDMIEPLLATDQVIYVCGPHAFVDTALTILRELSVDDTSIRLERFN